MNIRYAGHALGAIAASGIALHFPAALAQSYPAKPILVVSSASPGTSGDAGLRKIGRAHV